MPRATTMLRSGLLIVLACIISAMSTGCAASGDRMGRGPDRTGGVRVEFLVEHADLSASYYRVEFDGSIGFGGAHDARNRRLSWTGTMSDDDIDMLRDILRAHDLFTQTPASDGSDDPRYRVTVYGPDGRNRIRLHGRSESLDALHQHLHHATRARFDSILQTLPQPGTRLR